MLISHKRRTHEALENWNGDICNHIFRYRSYQFQDVVKGANVNVFHANIDITLMGECAVELDLYLKSQQQNSSGQTM